MEGAEPTPEAKVGQKSAVSVWAARVVFGILGLSVAALGFAIFAGGEEVDLNPAFTAALATTVLTEDGESTTFADALPEGPVVVNFYASWCGPCRAELPDFDEVSLRVEDQVTFLGINVDQSETTWRSFNEEIPVSYGTVFQPGSEIRMQLDLLAMPTTLFISADGEIVQQHGGILDDDSLIEILAEQFGAEV